MRVQQRYDGGNAPMQLTVVEELTLVALCAVIIGTVIAATYAFG